MLSTPAARIAQPGLDARHYQRHQPEQTRLYQIIEQHYPVFSTHLAEQGRGLPEYVQREFDEYLKCGRLEHGFLQLRCDSCHVEHLVAFSCKRRGFCPNCGARRMAESAALLVDEDLMTQLLGHSVTYRIAVGPQAGRKVFTLQTLSACDPEDQFGDTVGKMADFSLHAGVAAKAHERKKLERLCRYIARPAISEKRLSLTRGGNVRYQLKTPYRDGTTHVIFEPLDFIARLAALVPKPRVNLTRFHGVFAPNSKHRALVTPAKRGKGNKPIAHNETEQRTPIERHAAMTPDQVWGRLWAQRLKRVFNIDIETCVECGGAVKVIACIEDPVVIKKILAHLKGKASPEPTNLLPSVRAPPQAELFGWRRK